MKTDTQTLTKAMRRLADDIQSDDGVANAAIAEAAERLAELERENAALRELTSTLGAPNHINIPVEKWRELRADKERLDSDTILLTVDGERVHHVGVNLRAAIDAGRKEAQP